MMKSTLQPYVSVLGPAPVGGSATNVSEVTNLSEVKRALAFAAVQVERILDTVLPVVEGRHAAVKEAMRYAVFVGGKRLRPFLLLECARLFGVPPSRALRAASAIELLHTYSLVHDDLPCMDDDVLRRGQPTVHIRFDEATAVLAGDALLTLAFEVMVDADTHPSSDVRCLLATRLAQAAGSDGVVGGQMMDMLAPKEDFNPDEIVTLQRMKTGALFEFACEAGAILGGAGAEDRRRLRNYARDLGLAFQIVDDLIDALGSVEKAGKAVSKDQAQGKATLVSRFGYEDARHQAQMLADRAAEALSTFDGAADTLRLLPHYLLNRES
jgi:farnesyl diphosphate synthase